MATTKVVRVRKFLRRKAVLLFAYSCVFTAAGFSLITWAATVFRTECKMVYYYDQISNWTEEREKYLDLLEKGYYSEAYVNMANSADNAISRLANERESLKSSDDKIVSYVANNGFQFWLFGLSIMSFIGFTIIWVQFALVIYLSVPKMAKCATFLIRRYFRMRWHINLPAISKKVA